MEGRTTLPESDEDSSADKSPVDETTLPSSLPVTSSEGVDTIAPHKLLDN